MIKENLLLLFGGESTEHEVSEMSASNVIEAVNREKYNLITVGITKEGKWYLYQGGTEKIKDGTWEQSDTLKEAFLSPSKSQSGLVVLNRDSYETIHIDKCFPVLHGKNGEDGTVQGLLTLAGIPYVGSNVVSSAVCMDKVFAKMVLEYHGIPQTPYLYYTKKDFPEWKTVEQEVKEKLDFPCFVKPVNAGSSVGASKADCPQELRRSVEEAFLYDSKVMVEKYINCREIEVAVMGNQMISCAGPGEIVSNNEFYDYDTKYVNCDGVAYHIPADISDKMTNEIRSYALKAYNVLDCKGLCRIDFFVNRDDNRIYLNELNTLPGFTNISMYPKMWVSEGMSYTRVVERLLELASL